MRAIEISMNSYYLCTTAQSKTCKAAIARVREIAKHRPVIIAGRGAVTVEESDILRANFKR